MSATAHKAETHLSFDMELRKTMTTKRVLQDNMCKVLSIAAQDRHSHLGKNLVCIHRHPSVPPRKSRTIWLWSSLHAITENLCSNLKEDKWEMHSSNKTYHRNYFYSYPTCFRICLHVQLFIVTAIIYEQQGEGTRSRGHRKNTGLSSTKVKPLLPFLYERKISIRTPQAVGNRLGKYS